MQGNKAYIILPYPSFISSLLFLYFVSARLSNTEGEKSCGIQHVYIYTCIIVLCLYCICLLLYVALERGNKERS